jgi:hypothetical protein
MTSEEAKAEYRYLLEERLGIMCGTAEPTMEQRTIAEAEALAAVESIRKAELADKPKRKLFA